MIAMLLMQVCSCIAVFFCMAIPWLFLSAISFLLNWDWFFNWVSAFVDAEFCHVLLVYISHASRLILTMSNGILEYVTKSSLHVCHRLEIQELFSFGLRSNSLPEYVSLLWQI